MKTRILLEEERMHVVAFYQDGKLMWTTTYLLDDEGLVEKMIRVTPDGTVDIQ